MRQGVEAMKLEEYRFLRGELNDNRKYVFERPLLIVGATLASALGLSGVGRLGLLPVLFLAILLFNLWFTYNRVQSSARIIAYLQLVHEAQQEFEWVGWENALRLYRTWVAENEAKLKAIFSAESSIRQYHHMAYYAPTLHFHLVLGVAVTIALLASSEVGRNIYARRGDLTDIILFALNCLCLLLFASSSLLFRPKRVRHAIELRRVIWQRALPPRVEEHVDGQ